MKKSYQPITWKTTTIENNYRYKFWLPAYWALRFCEGFLLSLVFSRIRIEIYPHIPFSS